MNCLASAWICNLVLSTGFLVMMILYAGEFKRTVNNAGKLENEWPFKLKMPWDKWLVCTVPDPYFNVTDDQLNSVWHLPAKTRLSPLMRVTGRCKLASEWLRANGIHFDDQKCECADIWWPNLVFGMSLINLGHYICMLMSSASYAPFSKQAGERARKRALLWFLAWDIAMIVYGFEGYNEAGLFYTPYGEMKPRAYYEEPSFWLVMWMMCFANMTLEGIKFVVFSCMIGTAKKEERGHKDESRGDTDEPPPAYETLLRAQKRDRVKMIV